MLYSMSDLHHINDFEKLEGYIILYRHNIAKGWCNLIRRLKPFHKSLVLMNTAKLKPNNKTIQNQHRG